MTGIETYTFAVYPADFDESVFEAFLVDVPSLSGEDHAARRAWWTAFHQLGPRGIEPEQFAVAQWVNDSPGRLVTSGGLVPC
jgi:hypothetical protein